MKRDRTDRGDRSAFTPEVAAAVHINCIRPVLGALEDLILGGQFTAGSTGSDDAANEMRKANESLRELSRHVDSAIRSLAPKAEKRGHALGLRLEQLAQLSILKDVLK